MTKIVKSAAPVIPIPDELRSLLPAQGCVELQRDVPGKVHDFHSHQVDETLLVLDGALTFAWDGGTRLCQAGDRILLPAGARHKSEAMESGAIYAIAIAPS